MPLQNHRFPAFWRDGWACNRRAKRYVRAFPICHDRGNRAEGSAKAGPLDRLT